jgi:hypothetical protein
LSLISSLAATITTPTRLISRPPDLRVLTTTSDPPPPRRSDPGYSPVLTRDGRPAGRVLARREAKGLAARQEAEVLALAHGVLPGTPSPSLSPVQATDGSAGNASRNAARNRQIRARTASRPTCPAPGQRRTGAPPRPACSGTATSSLAWTPSRQSWPRGGLTACWRGVRWGTGWRRE